MYRNTKLLSHTFDLSCYGKCYKSNNTQLQRELPQRENMEYSLYLSILGPRQRPVTSDRRVPLGKELPILKVLFQVFPNLLN